MNRINSKIKFVGLHAHSVAGSIFDAIGYPYIFDGIVWHRDTPLQTSNLYAVLYQYEIVLCRSNAVINSSIPELSKLGTRKF